MGSWARPGRGSNIAVQAQTTSSRGNHEHSHVTHHHRHHRRPARERRGRRVCRDPRGHHSSARRGALADQGSGSEATCAAYTRLLQRDALAIKYTEGLAQQASQALQDDDVDAAMDAGCAVLF